MNWKQLIADLTGAGMTQAQIAAAAGVRQSTISELATGAAIEPKFSTGQRLVELHASRRIELIDSARCSRTEEARHG